MVNSKTSKLDRIGKAALKLIFNRGLKGWNMNDCAAEAGLSKRTVYQYIPSKEKLIEQAFTGFIRDTQKTLAGELAACPDFKAGLGVMLQIFPSLVIKMESSIIRDIFIQYPYIEKHITTERNLLAEESLQYIRKGQQDGSVKKSIEAETLLEILQSLIIYYSKTDPSHLKEKLQEGIRTLMYGVLEHE